MRRHLLPIALLAVVASVVRAEGKTPTFREVGAIFARSCVHCHGGDRPVEGLSLDSRETTLKGAASGPVVVVGEPGKSALIRRLRGTASPQMPFDAGPLPEAEITLVEEWIRGGAPDAPAETPKPVPPPAPKEDEPVTWTHVGPVLRANCVRCHQAKGLKGPAPEGIRFDGYDAALGVGERTAVVPGSPEASPLLRTVTGHSRKRMPLDGPPWLSDANVALLRRWIVGGARGEDGKPAPAPVGREVRLFGVYDGSSRVDGVDVGVSSETRVDRGVVRGTIVEVRASVLEGGKLRATRIRPRKQED